MKLKVSRSLDMLMYVNLPLPLYSRTLFMSYIFSLYPSSLTEYPVTSTKWARYGTPKQNSRGFPSSQAAFASFTRLPRKPERLSFMNFGS